MSGHAMLSPSAASRWMSCTASAALEASLPGQTTSFAKEGTQAHVVAEFAAREALGLPLPPNMFDTPDDEMMEAAAIYADHIKETYLKAKETCTDVIAETEIRLDLTAWIPEGFGTADCLIVADGTLYVIDFKYGKGVLVEAEGNKQMTHHYPPPLSLIKQTL